MFLRNGSLLQKIKGVQFTECGYANGPSDKTNYKKVCKGSGHVEVVKVEYEPDILSSKDLFKSFIRIIDPYSINKQGGDEGVQYRTGLYSGDTNLVNEFKALVEEFEANNKKTAIEVLTLINYVGAEDYHQKYLDKNPSGYCHINLLDIPEDLLSEEQK